MKESYEKGVAIHRDPEPWASVREDLRQASVGARAGRVLNREKSHFRDADIARGRWKATLVAPPSRGATESRAV